MLNIMVSKSYFDKFTCNCYGCYLQRVLNDEAPSTMLDQPEKDIAKQYSSLHHQI